MPYAAVPRVRSIPPASKPCSVWVTNRPTGCSLGKGLAPKKTDDAPFVKAKLGFGPTGLIRMELDDALGQHTVIAFSGWNRNPKFAKGDFAFTPPKGADVVGDTSEGAEVLPLHN